MRIAIIGAGFGGIGAAIRLQQAGFDDVVVLERGDDVGGVWRDNTYPGCACDVQSHLYSFSFAPNPSWSRQYSPQPEILAYLRRVADEHGVRARIRFRHLVTKAQWTGAHWHIEARDESTGSVVELRADAVVAANGALAEPVLPDIPGLASFAGKTMHTARWDKSFDLAGKNVAVVGTGASAIQLIPAIQPLVNKLTVFQRTPPWILPRNDTAISPFMQSLFARAPLCQRIARAVIAFRRELNLVFFRNQRAEKLARGMAKRHLKQAVPDYEVRKKLTPRYAFGCKRILLSDDYLPALGRPNVEVVTDAIASINERGVVAGGAQHDVDAIVFGTGFSVTHPPMAKFVFGTGGTSLAQAWTPTMRAYLGTTVHGFPNLFLLLGPNTGLGHSSVVAMIEAQLDHVVSALSFLRDKPKHALEPTQQAQDAFVADVDKKMV
ncbi:MAG TPA: NAD(P)/FAD-dependent oxidoreductase, partial [Myxococcota bacterium]